MVFGNQAAGDLVGSLFGLVDDDGGAGWLANMHKVLQNTLTAILVDLAHPLHDAEWAYGVLWTAVLLWMDARFTSMRSQARRYRTTGASVGLIERYTNASELVAERRTKPINYVAAHSAFQVFTKHVTQLITAAKAEIAIGLPALPSLLQARIHYSRWSIGVI
ncbi:hypothetical protein VP1G_11166 [Cytospora mali]|uniref:Uncharacterized protein n=1 Tax=Cytospora mali TaxID=578113 RepID=A0A194V7Y3_CYTMA|nr:hypothetical protein VP1G_11166 [Valsa mali var. pyri (nom. inval.)]